MEKQRLVYLLDRYAEDTISTEEKEEFLAWLHANAGNSTSMDVGVAFLAANENISTNLLPYLDIAENITRLDRPQGGRRIWMYSRRIAAVAIGLILAVSGAYMWLHDQPIVRQMGQNMSAPVIRPAREGAILTRTNGSRVMLDSLQDGELTEANGAHIALRKGEIIYTSGAAASDVIVYNTITTPNARTYHLRLQDGTEVWLNAGSSVTYPVAFNGAERRVSATGEVYFEVAKNPAKPFIVNVSGKVDVQVLGTNFNINAYQENSSIKATLLEGVVQLVRTGPVGVETIILKPGQEGSIAEGCQINVNTVNINEVMAWRNGLFHFNNASVTDIMRQLARWYDVKIIFEGPLPTRTFSGEIERTLTLEQVLTILKSIRINYTIDNERQITIRQ